MLEQPPYPELVTSEICQEPMPTEIIVPQMVHVPAETEDDADLKVVPLIVDFKSESNMFIQEIDDVSIDELSHVIHVNLQQDNPRFKVDQLTVPQIDESIFKT